MGKNTVLELVDAAEVDDEEEKEEHEYDKGVGTVEYVAIGLVS